MIFAFNNDYFIVVDSHNIKFMMNTFARHNAIDIHPHILLPKKLSHISLKWKARLTKMEHGPLQMKLGRNGPRPSFQHAQSHLMNVVGGHAITNSPRNLLNHFVSKPSLRPGPPKRLPQLPLIKPRPLPRYLLNKCHLPPAPHSFAHRRRHCNINLILQRNHHRPNKKPQRKRSLGFSCTALRPWKTSAANQFVYTLRLIGST